MQIVRMTRIFYRNIIFAVTHTKNVSEHEDQQPQPKYIKKNTTTTAMAK